MTEIKYFDTGPCRAADRCGAGIFRFVESFTSRVKSTAKSTLVAVPFHLGEICHHKTKFGEEVAEHSNFRNAAGQCRTA